ncbi:MAG: DUF4238 domain-containing protein [Negativicutes bacterium]
MENKPNQHYVWQNYLKPWKKGDQIICLRNKKDILQSNPRNVASQRYFYNISGLTLNDCKLIRHLFIDNQPERMIKLLEGWIEPIEQFLKIYDFVSKDQKVDDSIKEAIELTFKNLLEELHMEVEYAGVFGLSKLQSGDTSFLSKCEDEDSQDVEFITYLCFQYFRTKKIKQNVKENLGENALIFTDFDKAFNIIVLIVSTLLGYSMLNLIKKGEFCCCLLENDSETPFITGDQPVINIHAELDKGLEPTELALYYPLSPTMSMLITKEQIHNIKCSCEKVKEYNDMIERQSLEMIFANDESVLQTYILR